jgi:hypothetical protein
MKSLSVVGIPAVLAAAALALSGCGANAPAAPSAASTAAGSEATAPEAIPGMDEKSAGGLSATTYYYFEAMTYALQTGKTEPMLAVTADCETCTEAADAIAKVYADGGHIEGGQPKPQNVKALGKIDARGKLSAVVPFMQDAQSTYDAAGKVAEQTEWDNDGTIYTITGAFADGAWKITGLKETPAATIPE